MGVRCRVWDGHEGRGRRAVCGCEREWEGVGGMGEIGERLSAEPGRRTLSRREAVSQLGHPRPERCRAKQQRIQGLLPKRLGTARHARKKGPFSWNGVGTSNCQRCAQRAVIQRTNGRRPPPEPVPPVHLPRLPAGHAAPCDGTRSAGAAFPSFSTALAIQRPLKLMPLFQTRRPQCTRVRAISKASSAKACHWVSASPARPASQAAIAFICAISHPITTCD